MDGSRFESRFDGASRNLCVSPEIRELLKALDHRMVVRPWSFGQIRTAIVDLLMFLCTEEGRTDSNCRAVDAFVMTSWDDAWLDMRELPGQFAEILCDIGGQLHDTFTAPERAESFKSLPEQLLARARDLPMPGFL